MKEKDLLDNEIYVAKAGIIEYLFKNVPYDGKYHRHAYIALNGSKSFYQGTGGTMSAKHNSSFKDEYRLPTVEEKQHLLQCIAAGKYVDYKPQNKLVYGYHIL